MIYVKLTGRQFTPGLVEAGMSLDVNAETVSFTVTDPYDPAFGEAGIVSRVYWLNPLGARGFTALTLSASGDDLTGTWTIPKEASVAAGILQAEIRLVKTVEEAETIVWHSEPLRLNIALSLEDETGSTLEIPKYKTVTATAEALGYGDDPTASVTQGSDSIAFSFGLPPGNPGVYYGANVPPEGYLVWINPNGTVAGSNILMVYSNGAWVGIPAITGPSATVEIAAATGNGNAITALTALEGTITPAKGTTFVDSIATSGNGNVVSAVTLSSGKITFKKNVTALTAHQDITGLQTKSITDTGSYFTTDTVEAALQEIGATLDGLDTALAALL